MEINKQLFEDVLSGKLKGTFVLRNGQKIKSNYLRKNDCGEFCYNFTNASYPFTCNGYIYSGGVRDGADIVNFMPETNMKENELTIEIPDGKIVDWDESKKQNKIILKDKQLTYEDVCKKLFKKEGYYFIYGDGCIGKGKNFDDDALIVCPNHAATEHQLECILAKNKLATIAKYLNDGWKHDCYNRDFGYFICKLPKEIEIVQRDNYKFNNNVIFKSKEIAQQAIEILGEETVKLALEPLGI